MLRLAFDFIITWRETRTRPNAYLLVRKNFLFNLGMSKPNLGLDISRLGMEKPKFGIDCFLNSFRFFS